MKFNYQSILITVILFTLISAVVVVLTEGLPRIILGSILLLIVPGYTLLSTLIPGKEKINGFERFILSFGISFALIVFIGWALSFTPWGIKVIPIIITIVSFTLVVSVISWYRQKRIPDIERLSLTISPHVLRGTGTIKNSIWICIPIALALIFIGWVAYTVSTPTQDDFYTEFYILDSRGEAQNYPRQLNKGEPADIIVGIINHEYEATNYQIKILIDNEIISEISTGTIDQLEKWEDTIRFTPESCGPDQKVEIWLYRDDEAQPYQQKPLHFYIDVLCP